MKIAWVIGSTGLLGTALCRELRNKGVKLFFPAERFCWQKNTTLFSQFETAVEAFASQIRESDRWDIYWAAGVGCMSSPEIVLTSETEALASLLRTLKANSHLMAGAGAFSFASSAGAIYAGATDEIITENTPPVPTTAYAREKLRQEGIVSEFLAENDKLTVLIARITTLYGSGQSIGKQQGLLTHIARNILRNQPIQIYVPYDTIRDYISSDDAAAAIVANLSTNTKPGSRIKIIASERPTTIAEIISIFKRLSRRSPLIIRRANKMSDLYSRRVQFRSIESSETSVKPKTTLAVGIAQVLIAERAMFVQGSISGT